MPFWLNIAKSNFTSDVPVKPEEAGRHKDEGQREDVHTLFLRLLDGSLGNFSKNKRFLVLTCGLTSNQRHLYPKQAAIINGFAFFR